jgi:hypothetical protein
MMYFIQAKLTLQNLMISTKQDKICFYINPFFSNQIIIFLRIFSRLRTTSVMIYTENS